MPSEWAMNQAREDVGIFGGTSSSEPLIMAIAAAIDAARAQGRCEGLEEAAKIVEKYADHADAVGDMRLDVCCGTIAIDIRAAVAKEPTACAARAQGRREGLEEAARIAANGSEHVCGTLWCNDEVAHSRGDVAAEIRAAIAKEPTA